METTQQFKDPLVITVDLRKIGSFFRQLAEGMIIGMIVFSPLILDAFGLIRG